MPRNFSCGKRITVSRIVRGGIQYSLTINREFFNRRVAPPTPPFFIVCFAFFQRD
jgi:hypothetical protein